jgi:PAS domain S-box-containing protein
MTPHQREDLDIREQYLFLFESSALGIVYQNAQGLITKANPSAKRILGLNLEQMRGRTSIDPRWQAIYPDGQTFPGDQHPAMIALRTGQPVSDVIMGVINPEFGDVRWINISAVPQFKPGEDQPHQVCTHFEDITQSWHANLERERLLEQLVLERQRFEAVLAQMPLGVMVIDANSKRLSFYNAQIERQLGVSLAAGLSLNLINKTKYFLSAQALSSHELPLNKALLKGETTLGLEVEIERNDASRQLALVNAAPIRDSLGRITAAVLTLDDLTQAHHPTIDFNNLLQTLPSAQKALGFQGNSPSYQDEFIERLSEHYTRIGQPALEGQLVGLLLLNPKPVSLTQAAKRLEVTKVAISKVANAMLGRGDLTVSRAFSSRQHLLALTNQCYVRDLHTRRAESWSIATLCDRLLKSDAALEPEVVSNLKNHLEIHARVALNLDGLLEPIERIQARVRTDHLRDNWDAVEPKVKVEPQT